MELQKSAWNKMSLIKILSAFLCTNGDTQGTGF